MALYVVLRHPNHPEQTWSNGWRSDGRLVDGITTNRTVQALCVQAQSAGDYIYVYRCALGGSGAEITCRAKIKAVTMLGRDYLVSFHEPEPLAATPRVQPLQGDDYYHDAPPAGC
jgi:hypothetical protein